MRILIIEEEFNKYKGVSRYAVEIVEGLVAGNEVHLLTLHYDYNVPGVIVHKLPSIPIGGFVRVIVGRVMNSIYALIIRKRFNIDVVHSQGSESLMCDVVTMHSCHKAGIKQWNSVSKQELSYPKYLLKRIIRTINPYNILTVFIEGRLLRTTDEILAVSGVVKRETIESYPWVDSNKIKVVYSGVNCNSFKPDYENGLLIRSKFNLSKDDFVISFCGYEFKRKGLYYLIKSLPLLKKKVKLLVIGKDNESGCELLASELGVSDNIVFIGQVSNNLAAYFNASDIFVFPTTHEAFGLVIVEAMACGLPVIFSKLAGAAEIVHDEYDALLLNNPADIEEIAEKIDRLSMDSAMLKNMGKAAHKTALGYKWSNTAESVVDVYKEILKH